MLEKLSNIFRVPDLRKRVLFTLGLLAVYRLGVRNQSGLLEHHRALEQPRHLRLL